MMEEGANDPIPEDASQLEREDPTVIVPPDQLSPEPNSSLDSKFAQGAFAVAMEPSVGPGDWEPLSSEELDALLPAFEITGVLGRGGMGAVYEGLQKSLRRKVAIKLLPPEIAADPTFAERFQREAYAMAALKHQNIVDIYDFGCTSEGHYYFVMEFVEGTDLSKAIKTRDLSTQQTAAIIAQVCDALGYAHGMGYVHRDIKPANIFVASDGQVKVGDFGLAKLISGDDFEDLSEQMQLTTTGYAMGTANYVAPEALKAGCEIDHRADIYALGVMLYEMLTGEVPRGIFSAPSVKNARVDPGLDQVVTKAMQEKPADRFQSTRELKEGVAQIDGGSRFDVVKEERGAPSHRRNPFFLLSLCALPVLAIGVFLLVTRDKTDPVIEDTSVPETVLEGSPAPVESAEERPPVGVGSFQFIPSNFPLPIPARPEISGRLQSFGHEDAPADELPADLPELASVSVGVRGIRGEVVRYGITPEGRVIPWGPGGKSPNLKFLKNLTGAVKVCDAWFHEPAVLHDDGRLTLHRNWKHIAGRADLKNVADISSGYDHLLVLFRDGAVATWGRVENPVIENRAAISCDSGEAIAIWAGTHESAFLGVDGTFTAYPGDGLSPVKIDHGMNKVAYFAGVVWDGGGKAMRVAYRPEKDVAIIGTPISFEGAELKDCQFMRSGTVLARDNSGESTIFRGIKHSHLYGVKAAFDQCEPDWWLGGLYYGTPLYAIDWGTESSGD